MGFRQRAHGDAAAPPGPAGAKFLLPSKPTRLMLDDQHRAHTIPAVACAVLTASDTRTPATDVSGALIRRLLESAGHRVIASAVVPDDPGQVRDRVLEWCTDPACHAVLVNGGTGLSSRDHTYEAVAALLDKHLDGFGELFRMLSYHEIGPAAMLSRAVAGVCRKTVVFSLPGAPAAVQLGVEKLIIPELGHVVSLIVR